MSTIVGIDEVGRGCWAGPLVAAAVILDHNFPLSGVRPWKLADSKVLKRREREIAADEIRKSAHAVGIGWISPAEVDRFGLTVATAKAMRAALKQITADYTEIIIDGNFNYLSPYKNRLSTIKTVVNGDAMIPAVSAASIVAKVARDEYMREVAIKFPEYHFEKHVGYGTGLHLEMLKTYGVCELHRRSYKPIRALL